MVRSLIRQNNRDFLRLIFGTRFTFSHIVDFQQLDRCNNSCLQQFSTIGAKPEKLSSKGSSNSILLKLGRALKEHQVDEAWETYKDFKRRYGYPDQFLVANLITELSYSSDSKCLRRAYDLVLSISREKSVLLTPDMMTKLVLSLARAQIPVLASNVLRLMLEKRNLPSLDVLRMVFLHLVKTESGTYLASNILEEICGCFFNVNVKSKSGRNELTRPDVTIFNLVLDACVRFGTPLKGQQVMEVMPQVGVVGDAHTVVIIARIHEMNGMRDELKKFKDSLDMVSATLDRHYQQFYDSLLSLHFKFNDIDGASALLRDLCGSSKSNIQVGPREQQKSCTVSIGSENIKMGLRLQFLPEKLPKDFFYKTDSKNELLPYKNGKLVLSNKGLGKLIIGYKKSGRISELSKLLITIQNLLSLSENSSSCSDVIDACIYLGWLETAHDILEDLESEKYSVREGSYISLLNAYYNEKMLREAEGLLRQMKRVGFAVNLSNEKSFHSSEDKRASDLANSIIQTMREEDKEVPFLVHEYNSSIYFFTKAKMIEDAIQTYRKMQKMKIQPNDSTFFHLISGYSSLGMYREITIIWGDIRRIMENQNTVYNRDLHELLLLNFIHGGYFERVMEIVGFMMENRMFLDKWRYKVEFLKFHRDLYRNLTSLDAKDETQSTRIEYVKAFRKLVGVS